MSETLRLKLPLIHSNQAQKEITHNEALQMLDGIINPVVEAVNVTHPSPESKAGELVLIGNNPEAEFAGHENKLAQNLGNNGWRFYSPNKWQKVTLENTGKSYIFDGKSWQPEAEYEMKKVINPELPVNLFSKENGEYVQILSLTETIELRGEYVDSSICIPHHTIALAVNIRVAEEISGAKSFNVGVVDDPNRYGSNIGTSTNTTNIGLTGTPLTYYYDTAVRITANLDNIEEASALVVQETEIAVPETENVQPKTEAVDTKEAEITINEDKTAAINTIEPEEHKAIPPSRIRGFSGGKVIINIQVLKMHGPWNWE